jgi:uncharacterized membrane protein YbhN (UPF0104 family)
MSRLGVERLSDRADEECCDGHPGASRRQAPSRTRDLLERGWVPITVASLVSHPSLYLVLLVALRDVGFSDAEVAWAQVLATFTVARLITIVRVTPGSLGRWS